MNYNIQQLPSQISSAIKFIISRITQKEIANNFVFLPEWIRYAMQYRKAMIDYDDIWGILNSTFWRSWLYVMMKFYNNHPNIQWDILNAIFNNIWDDDLLYEELSQIYEKNKIHNPTQCHKLSTLSKYDFVGWNSLFDDIAIHISKKWQTPIVLLYAWILSLPSLLTKYTWDTIRLLNPKNPDQSIKLYKQNGKRMYSYEKISCIDSNHVFIDDIYNTGKAYKDAGNIIRQMWIDFDLDIYTAIDMKNSSAIDTNR